MIHFIDKVLNLRKDYLIESINDVFKENGINTSIEDKDSDSENSLVWNIYAAYFGYGLFVVECVHPLTDIDTGPYFEWYILQKDHTSIILANTSNFHFKSTENTFADVVEETEKLKAKEADYYYHEEQEYYRQRAWEQECFDREHFGGGKIKDENDEFNDMMDDFEAWGNID